MAHLGRAQQPRSLSLSSRALVGHLSVGRRYTDTASLLAPRRLVLPVPPRPDFNQLLAQAQQLEQQATAHARARSVPTPTAPEVTSPIFTPQEQARREQQALPWVLNEHNRTVQAVTYLPAFLRRALTFSPVNLTTTPPAGKDVFMPTSFWMTQAPAWSGSARTVYKMLAKFYGKKYHIPAARYDLILEHQTGALFHGIPVRDYYTVVNNAQAVKGLEKLDEHMAAHQPVMVGVSNTPNYYVRADCTAVYMLLSY